MQNANRLMSGAAGFLATALAFTLMTGCQSAHTEKSAATKSSASTAASAAPAKPAPPAAPAPVAAPATPAPAANPVPPPPPPPAVVEARPTVRIKAGVTAPFKDSEGNVWQPDTGFFEDGETTERAADLAVANTKDPALYRTERYSMTKFAYPLSNGKYTVKLHFAETYEGITGPGERVFSFNVEGQEFKDFDIWVKTGGAQRAYIETVPVEITDGKLNITFAPKVENPEINAIEIIPAS